MIPSDPDSNNSETESLKLVDWKAFDSLLDITEAWDEPQMMIDLLNQYETDARKVLIDAVRYGTDSHAEMRRVLHKLKGSSGSLAFLEVVTQIKILHDPLTAPPEEEKPRLFSNINKAITASLTAVRDRYPWLKAS